MRNKKQTLFIVFLIILTIFLPSIAMSKMEISKEVVSLVDFLENLEFSIGINSGITWGLDKLGEELKNVVFYPVGGYIQFNPGIIQNTKLEFDVNYIQLFGRNSDDIKMSLFPVTLSVVYNLPFSLGIDTYVKAGGGFVSEIMTIKMWVNYDKYEPYYEGENVIENKSPIFIFGIGSDLNILDWLILKTEVVYNLIYEKYIPEAIYNGHLMYFVIGIGYQFK